MNDPTDAAGWKVEFRGGPIDGLVDVAALGDAKRMIAALTVFSAVKEGIGSIGHFPAGGLFEAEYKYKVVSIDHDIKLVVVQLEPTDAPRPLYDHSDVTFNGGPHDGTVRRSGPDVTRLRGTPSEVASARICANWRATRSEGKSIVREVHLCPEVPFQQHLERLVEHKQDVLVKYRIDSAELHDRTLRIVCTYIGTDVFDTRNLGD